MSKLNELEKFNLLNETTLTSMHEGEILTILKNFTDTVKEIMDADFAFAWWKMKDKKYKLAYKTPDTPYEPSIPKAKSSHIIKKRGNSFYDTNVIASNYEEDISKYVKSFIIISIHYGEHVFGSIVICFGKPIEFNDVVLQSTNLIGNTIAQAVTINWLVESESASKELADKQRSTETLLEQEQLKTEFIGNATHEIRTPLAIMKGNVDLALMSKGDPKTSREALEAVNVEIKRLASIIADLELITTDTENYEKINNFIPVEVVTVITAVVNRLRVVAQAKEISIKLNAENLPELWINGEAEFIEKLFLNIIKNAITYGIIGGIIEVTVLHEKNNVKINICDDGIGISKEDLSRIFERFYRVDKSHTGVHHSGLGLAIVKWVVERHKGSIEVTSASGKGTTFTVMLPLLEKNS
ncbi:MAG: HAMP domain-containing sensor histidine kinase [Candidatus Paceibacterota bacterium]